LRRKNMSEITPKAHRATLILVFGILGLVLCMPLGIVAWVMGNGDLKEMDAGRMDDSGRGLTQVGKILGMVSVILTIVAVVIWLLMVFLMVGAAAAGGAANTGLLV
jgi:uncharacterized membrane protein YidH (DUF202 family)